MLQRSALRTVIYDEVARRIERDELSAGDRLRDTELGAQLGVSRTPVREALLRLERDGLVDSFVGRGFRVRSLSRDEAEEIYPILWTLEGLALRLSPPVTRVVGNQLRRLADDMRSERSPARCIALDNSWHATLLQGCPNGRLLRMIQELKRIVRRYELHYMKAQDLVRLSAAEHRAIAGIAQRRVTAAAALLDKHWRRALASLLQHIDPARNADDSRKL